MDCSICLGQIQEDHTIKKLSCGHKYHYHCYIKCVLNDDTIFIKCPLCREINTCPEKPFNDPFLDLKELCHGGRCSHKTRVGKRCKKNRFLLNDGCCKIHNVNYLTDDKYGLMSNFIYWVLMTGNKKRTKILMIDIAKKLVMKYQDIKDIGGIHYYFQRYYHVIHKKNKGIVRWEEFYDCYDLEYVGESWLEECLSKNILY